MLIATKSFTRRQLSQSCAVALTALALPSLAQRIADSPKTAVDRVRVLLQTPENRIDFATAKLELDSIIDRNTDTAAIQQKLNEMAAEVTAMMSFARRINSVDKVEALVAYLHQPGPWNKQQVFKYDLIGDPTGTAVFANKLLSTYLRTRLGNCVSMPILFVILAQKIGLHAVLSTAPNHVFVKFRDEMGVYQNVEATAGGAKKNSSYQRDFAIAQ